MKTVSNRNLIMRFSECNSLAIVEEIDTAATAAELETSLLQKYVSVRGASTKQTCYLAIGLDVSLSH